MSLLREAVNDTHGNSPTGVKRSWYLSKEGYVYETKNESATRNEDQQETHVTPRSWAPSEYLGVMRASIMFILHQLLL
jgi:hypothetical protein